MKFRLFAQSLRFVLLLALLSSFESRAEPTNAAAKTAVAPKTGLATPLAPPDATEKMIAKTLGEIFSNDHYLQHPLDKEISAKFYTQYLNALDGYHLHFLQSDLDEFEPYRTKLDTLTLKDGDTSLARLVFNRFMERFEQRITYTTNLILTGQFDFSGHERYTPDRRKTNAPVTMDELKEVWRQELRYQYLNEKLAAKDIQFTGTIGANAKGEARIFLSKDKLHPLGLDLLPVKFYGENHKLIGTLKIYPNQSNAVITLEGRDWKKSKKYSKDIYSESGEKLGRLMTASPTNAEPKTNVVNVVIATEDGKKSRSTLVTNLTTPEAKAGPAVWFPDFTISPSNSWNAMIQLNQKNMGDVVKNLTNRYVRLQKNFREYTSDNVVELYFNCLARAYDPHSDYMGRDQSEDFNIQMKLSLFGIGARLTTEDNYCKIGSLIPGPAQKSGKVHDKDRIVAVAQGSQEPVDVIGMKLNKVVNLIRGPKGTEVRLTIIPADAQDSSVRVVVPLIRAEIQIEDQRAKAFIYDLPGEKGTTTRLGMVDLPSFYADDNRGKKTEDRKTTSGDVARLITRLKKENVDGIILDLRANGGGFLDEAINLTGLFVKSGPVVQTKSYNGEIVVESSQQPAPLYDGPLVILTSRFSASASEITTGALQDYGRALVVGDRATYGKGTVQTKQDISFYLAQKKFTPAYDPGGFKITIKKFYRAGGSSTQNKGVIPDIVLPSKNSYAEFGEEFADNALEWDTVTSADPPNLFRVKPYLPELKKRSAARLQSEKELVYWSEDVEHFKKMVEEKSVSMNEAERLADSNRDKARLEARKKERATRKKSAEKSYEIKFENIDDAVLHPPPVKTNEVASVASDSIGFDEDGEMADAKAPSADVILLDETKRILVDYISLLKKDQAISKAH